MQCTIDGVCIRAIASDLPEQVVSVDSYTDFFGPKKVKRLKKSTGIESVHVVSSGETASDLCLRAAEKIFLKSDISKDSIDGVVFASISPDYRAPGTAGIIQDRLGLSTDIVALDLTFGCSAYIYGLYEASMMIKAGGCERVLLCTGDTQSRLVNDKDRSMKMLVGDAGTATVVERGNDSFSFYFKTVGSGYQSLIIPAGGCRLPADADTCREVEDEAGNIRSRNDLYMNGAEVMKFALAEVPTAMDQLYKKLNLTKEEVDLFAFHQPNKLILDYLKNAMELDDVKCPVGLQHVGNTASASIPLLLTTLQEQGYDFHTAKEVIACGFGIGLSIGAVHVDLSQMQVYS